MLAGDALLGKGFASIGVAPLFVGEVALAAGVLLLLHTHGLLRVFATAPSVGLTALLAWVAFRVAPGFELFGVPALRDGVVVFYAVSAFVVIAVVTESPDRLNTILRLYGKFALAYGFWAAPVFFFAGKVGSAMPLWPISQIPLIYVRPGEIAVHLVGVSVFMFAGLGRPSRSWIALVVLGLGMISPSRGAFLAAMIPLTIAFIAGGNVKRMLPLLLAGVLAFSVGYAADVDIPMQGGRSMGPRQIVHDVESLLGRSDEANLDNTKAWRLTWWNTIVHYTFHGTYFWTGKGFGQSLAEVDGFIVGEENGGPLLRSPHNAHLTMLARSGVPGLVLWVAMNLLWFVTLLRGLLVAGRRGDLVWRGIFLWLSCYCAAILIDASFDVALEGPMLGIWYWCLIGLGIAATMVYRNSIRLGRRDNMRGVAATRRRV